VARPAMKTTRKPWLTPSTKSMRMCSDGGALFDPEAFSPMAVNQQLQKKFRSARRKVVAQASTPEKTATDRLPNSALLPRLLTGPGTPPKDRKRIRPDETVRLELNDRDRELILKHSLADEELTNRLRVVPSPGEAPLYRFTLDELDELTGYIAAEANHAKDKKLQRNGTGSTRDSRPYWNPTRTKMADHKPACQSLN